MSTRGFLGFVADNHETITYSHADSYPDYLGINVLDFARSVDDWGEVKRQAAALVHVDDDTSPTPEQIERLTPYADFGVDTHAYDTATGRHVERKVPSWYQLLRETQGDPAAILAAGHADHAPEWPGDSLFCEWGYLIDLDQGVLEVYRGFQDEPHTEGRFQLRLTPRRQRGEGYYPVRRIASWPLADLPDTGAFLKALNSK